MKAKLKLTVNGSSKPYSLLCIRHGWFIIGGLFETDQPPIMTIERYHGPEIECEECANATKLPSKKPGVYLQT